MVLVGSDSPSSQRGFFRDLDVTIFSEIVEFALSLSTSKGQDSFSGLPHLQAYKLLRASHLAEMGHVELANR
jgi:COPII coat assembly protein SEC16